MDNKINQWLQTYTPINQIAIVENIHSEKTSASDKNLALQRTGFEDLGNKYIHDRGYHRRYQYMLLLKSESEIDTQRLNNLDWLDKFSDWLSSKNAKRDFPILEGNKKITNVSCANALTYQEDEDGAVSIYSLQIYFNVRKEI